MAESIRCMDYFYVMVSNKPGQGAKIASALAAAGVNLLAFSGFPNGKKAQVVFLPDDAGAFRKCAKKLKLKISKAKSAFLIQGDDRVGALTSGFAKLAKAKINVTAVDAVSGGKGRYGAILWVKQKHVKKAGKALGVR